MLSTYVLIKNVGKYTRALYRIMDDPQRLLDDFPFIKIISDGVLIVDDECIDVWYEL